MHPQLFIPLAAVLALAACNDKQTASNGKPDAPAATTAAKPAAPPAIAVVKAEPAAPAAGTSSQPATTAAAPSTSAAPGATVGTTDLKKGEATGSVALTAPNLQPGRYQADPIALRLEAGNKFVMTEREGNREVQGRYEYKNAVITFTDASGDLGKAKFPIRCKVETLGTTFKFVEDGGSCQALNGLTFRPTSS